jgi:hypothetical protein
MGYEKFTQGYIILDTKPIADAVIFRNPEKLTATFYGSDILPEYEATTGNVLEDAIPDGVRIVKNGQVLYVLDTDKIEYLLGSNIFDSEYQETLAFQVKEVSRVFNLKLDRIPGIQEKLEAIEKSSRDPGKDSSPTTKDGSGGGSGGGGGGTEETAEQKAARLEAEEKAKEKAAAESAKKAEENLDIAKKLKSAPDSDQCKISRLYTPLQTFYFKKFGEGTEGSSLFVNNKILFCEKEGELAQDQNLTKNSSSDMDLFYLENHKYSAFTPSVELYKVVRERNEAGTLAGITNIVHIAFPTSGKVTEKSLLKGTQDTQLEMDNIGIKSVNWHFDGTDRYTADKYVSAEVVLVAENFDSLFVERNSIGQSNGVFGSGPVDLAGTKYRIADLLFRPGCIDTPVASRPVDQPSLDATSYSPDLTNEYKPECFEILLVAGNSVSQTASGNLGIPGSAKMKVSMFLTLLDHQFDFKENGSVEIRIRYRGRLEAMLRSPAADVTIDRVGLFASDALLKQISDISKVEYLSDEIKKQFEKYSPEQTTAGAQQKEPINYTKLQQDVDSILRGISPANNGKKEDSALREAKAKLQQVETLIDKEVKLQFFSQVSKILVDSNKIFNLSIQPDDINTQNYLDNPSTTNWSNLVDYYQKQFNDPASQTLVSYLDYVPKDTTKPETPAEPTTPAPAETPAPTDTSSPPSEAEEDQEDIPVPKDIPFVFFGDLLDSIISVCNNLKANGGKDNIFENIKIVLSNVKLPDFSNNKNGAFVSHSIAALPVTYKTLNSFANNKTSIGKKSYSFLSLIRDMINFIIPECLGTQCSQNQFMPSVRSNLYSFTSFGSVSGFDSTTITAQTVLASSNTAGGVSIKTILPRFKDEYDHNTYLSRKNIDITEMLLVYVENTDYSSANVGFDIIKDKNIGIPWYIFGYDRGIFKKAQLTKMDQPFVLEARFRENKGAYLNQFSNMYKATIEMVGNNLLNVGGYIWLDFEGISTNLGSPKTPNSISYYMGLGGLYLIIDIKSNMTPGNFTTTVEARFVSRGIGGLSPASQAGVNTVVVVPAPVSPTGATSTTPAVTVPATPSIKKTTAPSQTSTAVTAIESAPPTETPTTTEEQAYDTAMSGIADIVRTRTPEPEIVYDFLSGEDE